MNGYSAFDLATDTAKRLNVVFTHNNELCCYSDVGKSILYWLSKSDRDEWLNYNKELKFHYCTRINKVDRYVRLIGRILRPRNGIYCVHNISELERRIKDKYGLHECGGHYNYTVKRHFNSPIFKGNANPAHKAVNCACCGKNFLISSYIDRNHAPKCCSRKCKSIYKAHDQLCNRYIKRGYAYKDSNRLSKKYKSQHKKGQLPLITMIKYLSIQKKHKIRSLKA